ncbi:hypothetical protein [Bacillus sp. Marseille-P3661]|uniref:hypothetical protein n=1 Tax=Bacillus sp. Marseille-P3661 TaxID=1936234 RepID=UPI000C82372F|nr:hypothetical protein [Bacillus sp. Marseille-P3661]
MKNPLELNFGLVSEVFKYIHEQALSSGLYVHLTGNYQTLQLFRDQRAFDGGEKYIGAIQFEGSNNFDVKPPSIVSLRFKRSNLSKNLLEELESITDYRKDKNSGPNINTSAESIAFKFESLDYKAKETIGRIGGIVKQYR